MSDLGLDLLLLAAMLGVLEALLLLTHGLRHRAGLFPVCLVISTLVFFLMMADSIAPRIPGPGGVSLPVNSLTIFPTILFGVLLVFTTEGRRATWILVGCLMGVYALSLGSQCMARLWLRWPGLTLDAAIPAELVPLDVMGHVRSAVSLAVDVAVITAVFTLLARRATRLPLWGSVWVAFAAGLMTDAVVYPLLLLRPMLILQDLPGQVIGKLAVSVLMSLPMIFYLRQHSAQWLKEELGGSDHFDLFHASGDLRRSLQMSERRFREIIDQSPAAIVGFNRRGRVILWNLAAGKIYGLSPEEAQGRPAVEFLSDGSVEQLRDVNRLMGRTFEGDQPEEELAVSFERGGKTRHLSGNLVPLRGVGGEVLFGVATMHDITRLVEMERSLTRAKERMGQVVDSIREGMAVIDRDGRVQLWNRAAETLTGRKADEVLNKTLREGLPDFLGAPSPMGTIERALNHGERDTLEHIAGPGAGSRVYEVRLFPYSGGVTIFFNEVMLQRRQ